MATALSNYWDDDMAGCSPNMKSDGMAHIAKHTYIPYIQNKLSTLREQYVVSELNDLGLKLRFDGTDLKIVYRIEVGIVDHNPSEDEPIFIRDNGTAKLRFWVDLSPLIIQNDQQSKDAINRIMSDSDIAELFND